MCDHDHSPCSPGKDYERNLVQQRLAALTRRQVLQTLGTSGLLLAGSGINAGPLFAAPENQAAADPSTQPYLPQGSDDFDGFVYLSGDHHIHTRYSPDAKYAVQRQVAEASYHGLGWMVITDHGGPAHNKLSVDLTYPDILAARDAFKSMLLFSGLEMNIPGAEHGTVMVQPNPQERIRSSPSRPRMTRPLLPIPRSRHWPASAFSMDWILSHSSSPTTLHGVGWTRPTRSGIGRRLHRTWPTVSRGLQVTRQPV